MGSGKKKKKSPVNKMHAKVLVVGAGIAGTCAAVSAAETLCLGECVGEAGEGASYASIVAAEDAAVAAVGSGAAATKTTNQKKEKSVPVLLASNGPVFSGSSFFEGTWGLGLIAPVDSIDEEDLAQTILRVGEGVANEKLVRSFVAGIRPSIERLKSWGVSLKQASESALEQREYIPCFDHKHRAWNGIERKPYVHAMSERISAAGITVKSGWELLDIDAESRVATFFAREEDGVTATQSAGAPAKETCFRAATCSKVAECGKAVEPCFVQVHYDALVLCTGGASSLFTRHLTKDDCCATVQGLAQLAGCQLTNMAFMQFMPGIISPVQGVVFNEKTFRFMALDQRVQEALGGKQETQRLLDMRSTYGPFTCRLESCAIDFAIAQAEKQNAIEEVPGDADSTSSTRAAGTASTTSPESADSTTNTASAQGLTLLPKFENIEALPEFVQTYLSWLKDEAGVNEYAPLSIAMYAHANNGGIAIDQYGYTGIPGIFAAGECTGGMHGADRLGGLSSANGLVFGMRAGESAAKFVREAETAETNGATSAGDMTSVRGNETAGTDGAANTHSGEATCTDGAAAPVTSPSLPSWMRCASQEATLINQELSRVMDESCMIVREKVQVERALARIDELSAKLESSLQEINNETTEHPLTPAEVNAAAKTRTVQLRLLTARAMVEDILQQPQSRGSHYWSN